MTFDSIQISPLEYTYVEFCQKLLEYGFSHFYSKSIYHQFFKTGKLSVKEMKFGQNTPQSKIDFLNHLIRVPLLKKVTNQNAGQTKKIIFRTHDGYLIESVVIRMKKYKTLCISSQVGCSMACRFCETAKLGLIRNLSKSEILSQVFYAKYVLKEPIRNIVFMGMGEPLDNYDSVMGAIDILMDDHGFNFKQSHITISTSGRVDGIEKMKEQGRTGILLALSLNASNDGARNQIMPINKKYPLKLLKKCLSSYPLKNRQVIFVEYVLIKNINDQLEDAQEVFNFCQGLPVRINLIPFNPGTLNKFETASKESIQNFADYLRNRGLRVTLRGTKGDQIMAACGQLGTNERNRKREVLSCG